MIRRAPAASALFAVLLLFGAVAWAEAPLSRTDFVLWTTCTITLEDHASQGDLDAAFARLREIQDRFGTGVPGSELEQIAAAAGRAPVHVTDDVYALIKKALTVAADTNGLFDLTVGPLIDVWRMNKDNPDIPSKEKIKAALSLVNWRDVVVDDRQKTVFLKRRSMRLDLGGFLKGYAADEMVRVLSARGVRSALIDLGGNIFAMGSGPSGGPWKIGVQDPEGQRGAYLGIALVANRSVTTAGVYEHYFIKNGKRYHHIMDLRTGYPVENGLVSVTVIADKSIDADAYDTALLVMGKTDGIRLAERIGLDIIMVDDHHRLYATPGARRIFTLAGSEYSFAE